MSEKANEILKNIQDKKIKPKSRWIFILKDCCLWGLFALATISGALAVSVIIFIFTNSDWDIYRYLQKSFWSFVFISLPYFWIIILVGLSFLAYFNYRHTRKGYLLNPYTVVLGSIGVSILLGGLLFVWKMGEKMENICAKNIPYYTGLEMRKQNIWSNPNLGLLSGEIIEIEGEFFYLKDFNLREWKVIEKKTIWRDGARKEEGEEIKIIGKNLDEEIFQAQEVRPWGCNCVTPKNGERSCKTSR